MMVINEIDRDMVAAPGASDVHASGQKQICSEVV
jgi:hypothetical protein